LNEIKIICDPKRLEDKIVAFSKYGDTGHGGITRFSLSEADLQARGEFVRRMQQVGADIKTDDMANIYATIKGTENIPGIVMASHLDSVRNGGNYDGVLGVLAGMEVLETIVLQGIQHRRPITVMVWTNEEGSLYPPAMMSSGVLCDKFNKCNMLASKSSDGRIFEEALKESGYEGESLNRLNPKDYIAMLEMHIEQGPILEQERKDIGIVEGVLGMVNYKLRFYGQSDHAGTTPMKYRKDALLAAAIAIKYLHEEIDKLSTDIVYTTGEISCHPCIHTVIPDFVEISFDARHKNPEVLKQVVKVIENIPKEIEKCRTESEMRWSRDTVLFNNQLIELVEKNANEFGYSNMRIYSGAGHDAQYAQEKLPTTMIFVPSKDGHSHCEPEFTSLETCWKGSNVLLQTVLDIDRV
jgi:N-carbamoyl-L-amino-acid hydrolase